MSDSTDERRRTVDKRSWIGGGSTVRRWDWLQLGWALIALGAGLVASRVVAMALPGGVGSLLSLGVLWIFLVAAVAGALRRSRPRGLFVVRPVDVLWGLVLGVALRIVQGWLFVATGGPAGFPSTTSMGGGPAASEWAVQLATAGIVGPVVEELFFRGVVLVTVYSAVRRMLTRGVAAERVAAAAAVLVSAVLFALSHLVGASQTPGDVIALFGLGVVNGVLVVTTRRIWGAVLVHVVYNSLYLGLLVVGTVWG